MHLKSMRQAGVLQYDAGLVSRASPLPGESNIQHWIFTPSSGRASGQKQAFMHWSKAVNPEVNYVRVLVVKPTEVPEYLEVVRDINSSCMPMQQTMVMSLPARLSLKNLQGLSAVYKSGLRDGDPDVSLGAGYSRLCIQLVAHAMQLSHVWMLDDNIQDCWQINLQAQSLRASPSKHDKLQPCSFDTLMRGIEEQVSKTQDTKSSPGLTLTHVNTERHWKPARSPRKEHTPAEPGSLVRNWFDYGGSCQHYAIIGPNRQPYRYNLVGATWPSGADPPPFKITHSVFSFFLLNVEATMCAKELVLWPARQYAEDIEFHHMCEDSKLAVVKCNRFFFHKTNLQGPDLKKAQSQPRVTFHPTQGPMWGGQELHVQTFPAQHVTSVTICGATVPMRASQGVTSSVVLTPALKSPLLSLSSGQSNIVLSSSIVVESQQMEPLTAEGHYFYHGLWRWPLGTSIDAQAPDIGKAAKLIATIMPENLHDIMFPMYTHDIAECKHEGKLRQSNEGNSSAYKQCCACRQSRGRRPSHVLAASEGLPLHTS